MKLHTQTASHPVVIIVPTGPKDMKGIAEMRRHEARQAQLDARLHFSRTRTTRF